MTQQRRLLVAIGLSFGLLTAWQLLVDKPRIEAEAALRAAALDAGYQAELAAAEAAAGDGGTGANAGALAVAQLMSDDAGMAMVPVVALPMRTIAMVRPTMKLELSTEGAGLETAELQGQREHVQRQLSILEGYQKLFGKEFVPGAQMNMAQPGASGPPQLGVSMTGPWPLNGRLRYAVTEEQPGRLTFVGHDGIWEVTKTFTWNTQATTLTDKTKLKERDPSGYELQLDVSLKNTSTQTATGELLLHLNRAIEPGSETAQSMFGGIGNQAFTECVIADKLHKKTPDDEKPDEEQRGAVQFIAIDQSYFVSAVWSKDGAVEGRCLMHATTGARQTQLAQALTVPAGQTVTKRFEAFLGPKDLEMLAQVGVGESYQPNIDKTVDFGWWAVICRMLLFFLRFFHGLLGNWGLAIILLTVMVKVVLLPLTHRAMANGEKMREVQVRLKPSLDEINAKYAADAQLKQQKTMELYQKEGVNPLESLSGCLPMLLQLPIWAALFTTLRTSYDLYGEPFGVWTDLTHKDPTYLLPLALGVTMIVTQRLQPQMTTDKSQLFMFQWVMPVFFTAIMMNYPAGLALYIFTNNLLSIVQQYALKKWLKRKSVTAGPIAGKKAGAA